jgi:hypothetical protein
VYATGILFLAPLGAYVQYMAEILHHEPRSFTVLAGADAVLLYITTAVAVAFARQRRLTLHRQWMTRSYAVALVFFEGRLILGVTGLETAGVEIVQAVIWTCLALSVPLGDVINDWNELRRPGVSPSRSPARGAPVGAMAAPSA